MTRRRGIWIGSAVLAALLIAAIVPEFRRSAVSLAHPDPVGPTAYSKSAIGHIALFQLLQQLGIRAAISESGSGGHVSPDDVLVIAEPRTDDATLAEVRVMLEARTVLLVLPKRTGSPDRARPYWLGDDKLVSEDAANKVLHLADPAASVTRAGFQGTLSGIDAIAGSPSLSRPQLFRSKLLAPLLADAGGILIGERRIGGRRIVVLSDPDLIANHGLAHGENSVVAVGLIEYLRGGSDGLVIFDEFIHGFSPHPFQILALLFQFPFILVTLQMGLAAALLVWAATARFGAPAAIAPPIEAGKRSLIDTGARLLDQAGRIPELWERYFEEMVRDTARRLGGPARSSGAGTPLPGSPEAGPSNRNPQTVWTWRKELLGGSRTHTQPD